MRSSSALPIPQTGYRGSMASPRHRSEIDFHVPPSSVVDAMADPQRWLAGGSP